jgi:hypothetical protein
MTLSKSVASTVWTRMGLSVCPSSNDPAILHERGRAFRFGASHLIQPRWCYDIRRAAPEQDFRADHHIRA